MSTALASATLALKGYRSFSAMSEETTAFVAKVLLDGKVIGDAKNDGQGGCTMVHIDWPKVDRAILAAACTVLVRAEAEREAQDAADWMRDLGVSTLAKLDAGEMNEHALLEYAVDSLVTVAEVEKEKARIEKWIIRSAANNAKKGFHVTVVHTSGDRTELHAIRTREYLPTLIAKHNLPAAELRVVEA